MSDINVDTPGASGANPTATASDVAVNGNATTFMRSDGAPAVQKTSSSVFGLCKVDNTTITASGGVITAVPGGGGVGNVTGPASSTDTAIATWNGTAGTALRNNSATLIDASGNISTTGKFTATGNVSGGNLTTAGVVSATGNVSGGNLTTAGVVSATGNVTGGNLTTAGLISATGNISGGNLTTVGLVSATGNISGANIGNITPTNLNGNATKYLDGTGNFTVPTGTGGSGTLYPSFTIPVDGNYAWINQGGASTTVNGNGGIFLSAPKNSGLSVRIRKLTIPTTGGNSYPYTLTTAFFGNLINQDFQDGGIVLRKSGTGEFILFGFRRSTANTQFVIQKYNSATSFNGTTLALGTIPIGGVQFLKVQDDSTNRLYSFSMDGYNFVQILSETHATFIQPDEAGFCVSEQTNVYAIGLTLLSWNLTTP